MKKILFLLAIPCMMIYAGCGNSKKGAKIPGMIELDLSSKGRPITLNVPDSSYSKGALDVQATSFGANEIRAGKNFAITIKDGEGNMQLKKDDLKGDVVRKLVKIHIDEPYTLMYETQIDGMKSVFRFYSIVKIGNNSYEVEDIDSEGYSKEAVEKMLQSVKSIRVSEGAKS